MTLGAGVETALAAQLALDVDKFDTSGLPDYIAYLFATSLNSTMFQQISKSRPSMALIGLAYKYTKFNPGRGLVFALLAQFPRRRLGLCL